MELFREEPQTVSLKVPAGTTTVTAKVLRDGEVLSEKTLSANGNDTLTNIEIDIPFSAVRYDGPVVALLTSLVGTEPLERRHFFDVVTPVLSIEKIAGMVGDAAEPQEVEKFVRHVVESYTGQSFGYRVGKEIVQGNGESRLYLRRRLLVLKGIKANGVPRTPTPYAISGDGWYLYTDGPNWLEIREAPPDELLDYHISGPIRVPAWYRERFSDNVDYVVDGEWGYYHVPADVQAAAALLVNDYACPQAPYRDRYLNLIKSSDWTLDYNEQAWAGTGNARADSILNKYKRGDIGLV